MKEYFSNKTLLYVVAGLCLLGALWEFPICLLFRTMSICTALTIVALALEIIPPLGVGILAFTYLVLFILPVVFSVMILFNRRSAGFTSIGILVLSVLNMLFYGLLCFSLVAFLCLLYWAALVLLTVLLRRSRPGAPTTRSAIDMNNL